MKLCEELGAVKFSASGGNRFKNSDKTKSEPDNAIWSPTKSNHEAIDFSHEPRDICLVTLNPPSTRI